MSKPADNLVMDVETFSAVDLKRAGAVVYAADPSTQVLCLSYALGAGPVQTWVPNWAPVPLVLAQHVSRGGDVVAHNSVFERSIWNYTLRRSYPSLPELKAPQLTRDTMVRGLSWGFPGSLDALSSAMGLPFGKDMPGHRIMMQLSKPRGGAEPWHATNPEKFRRLIEYCERDVLLERVIDALLPLLPPDEAEAWVLDQKMNDRGLPIDAARIAELRAVAAAETSRLDRAMSLVTAGAVPNCRAVGAIKNFLGGMGLGSVDLAKGDVSALLARSNLPNAARQVLELRQEAAKTSVAKLDAMEAFSLNGIMRHVVQFAGAGRTLRWAGRGPQIQNYPRPHLKRDALEDELSAVRSGSAMRSLKLVSSALRSCVVAFAGMLLVVVDFAQIEARILAWLAGQADILAVFASGEDVYTYTAKRLGSKDRQMGKIAVLGLGYGLGWAKFIEMAATYGIALDEEFAKQTVYGWRNANAHIVALWKELETLAKHAVDNPGHWYASRTCAVRLGCFWDQRLSHWVLFMQLPSGRHLIYREPINDPQEGLSYMGLDQYTKQWTRIRTYGGKLAENLTQAVARDCLRDTMRAFDAKGFNLLVSIHDEIVSMEPRSSAQAALATMETMIAELPSQVAWMTGLPLKGEGFVAERYGKG